MTDVTPELVSVLTLYFNLNLARAKCIAFIILGLFKVGSVNIAKLALCIPGTAQQQSKYRRIQRLFSDVSLPESSLAKFIINKIGGNEKFILIMDRTNWMFGKFDINILCLSVAYHGVSIPIFWSFLPKKGNSNTSERIDIVDRYLKLFGADSILFLVADREFIGKQWFLYLIENVGLSRIRIKDDALISKRRGGKAPARNFCRSLNIGECYLLDGQRTVYGVLAYITIARLKDEYLIIASFDKSSAIKIMDDYAKRWKIEVMFKCLKSSGFNLEHTHLTDRNKLNLLMGIVTISFLWSCLAGEYKTKEKEIKVKTHKRKEHTIFKYGLELLSTIFLNLGEQLRKAQEAVALLRNPPLSLPPPPEDFGRL